jgi:predicted dehydrogenase
MEKPLIHDEQLLEKMSKEWKNEQIFFIGFVLRYHPLIKILKNKLDQKIIGEIFSARLEFGSYLPDWHPGEQVSESYAGLKALGGGVINTVSHELDLMTYLFGTPQNVTAVKSNRNYLQIDVEELAEAIFTYSWGLTTIHLDYLQQKYDRSIKVLGSRGKMVLDWPSDKLIIEQNDSPTQIFSSNYIVDQLYLSELKDFLYLIKRDIKKHPLDFSCAELNTRWILNMHKSAEKEKQWEKLLTGSLS